MLAVTCSRVHEMSGTLSFSLPRFLLLLSIAGETSRLSRVVARAGIIRRGFHTERRVAVNYETYHGAYTVYFRALLLAGALIKQVESGISARTSVTQTITRREGNAKSGRRILARKTPASACPFSFLCLFRSRFRINQAILERTSVHTYRPSTCIAR